jgi:hypothetical protein
MVLMSVCSCDCELRPRLLHLPGLRPSDGRANDPRLAQVPRLPRRRLRDLHDANRSHDLVRYAQDPPEPLGYLECAAKHHAIASATAGMSTLRPSLAADTWKWENGRRGNADTI